MGSWRNLKIRYSFILAAALMFCLSFALAVTALSSSKPTAPVEPSASCVMSASGDLALNAGVCRSVQESYNLAMMKYDGAVSTLPELSESFFAVALLCLVAPLLGKVPTSLKRKAVALPIASRLVLASAAVVGTSFFVMAEGADVYYLASGGGHFWLFFWPMGFKTPLYAVVGLGVATLCVGLLTIGKGLSTALKSAVLFGSSWVLAAQICIYHFDYIEMYLQVTSIVRVKDLFVFGFPILNNWFCLIVAGGLFVLSLTSLLGPRVWRVGGT